MAKLGRPSKYDPKFCAKVREYIDDCQDQETERVKSEGDKTTTYELGVSVNLPMIEGFATYLGVHKDTIYEWAQHYPNFSDALDEIMVEQKKRLLNNGLSNIYNPLITKLVLSANHGMREKQEIDHTSGGDKIGMISTVLTQIENGPEAAQ